MWSCDEYKAFSKQCQKELKQAKEYIALLESKLVICGKKQTALEDEIQGYKESSDVKDIADRILQHDLRGALVASASLPRILLGSDMLTDAQREILTMIEKAGNNMLEILDSNLLLYRLEEGNYAFSPENLNMLDVLNSVVLGLKQRGKIHGNDIVVESSGECAFVEGDKQLLSRAFSNILLNAIEASTENVPIYIVISADERCNVQIRNSGEVPVGIRSEFFNKFITHGKKEGTGLGTYSAKLMIEAQHGDIALDSSGPGVTTINVSLPIAHDVPA